MNITRDIYASSLTLLTDFYQLTMAYGYWKQGISEKKSVFHLFFRENPFNGGFTINCGLAYAIDYINNFRFDDQAIDFLAEVTGEGNEPLFEPDFLDYLRTLKFSCDVDAIPEGKAVFPHEPLLRVQGPILQCQLIESPLLNFINFQTLIATKAARIHIAARGEPVLEFGLRRAQGIDGAIAASRAAYVGGSASTSNVLAGKLFGIPLSGTHAHSWIMAFDDELSAFKAYANAMPNNCVLLVDTYNTLEGIKKAVEVGLMLKKKGKQLLGVRIDSGDLAYFSIEARRLLDAAGLIDTKIVASNDLDENIISSLRSQDAKIDVWGIGTKLVTAYDQPALGAVYKLSAIENNGEWEYKIKLSEQALKVNTPGIQQVRRFYASDDRKDLVADMLYDTQQSLGKKHKIIDPMDLTRRKLIKANEVDSEDLLIPVFRQGKQVYDSPDLHTIREQTIRSLAQLPAGVKRFVNPHSYPVGLEEKLFATKTDLVLKLRELNDEE